MVWRDGRAVNCDSLENCWGGNSSVGSNPTLSARNLLVCLHMNSFPQKKALLHWVKIVSSYIGVVILLFWCIQPQYFQVDYQKHRSVGAYPVYASFSDKEDFWSIKLDNLIVGEDGSSKISYTVKAGDTIQSIAQQFGTTVQSISDSNGVDNRSLQAGKVLYISYDNGVMINLKETSSVKAFVEKYNLDLQDTMSLNYFETPDLLLEQDQEVFVNLTQKEAEKRGLIEKEPYQSPFEKLRAEQEELLLQQQEEDVREEEPVWPIQQQVISPEETAQQIADQFKVTREEAGIAVDTTSPEEDAKKPLPPQPVINESQKSCDVNMCLFDGQCYYKPQQAYCIKDDPKRMWKCKQWYIQQGNTCVTVKEKTKIPVEKKKTTLEQKKKPKPVSTKAEKLWYFNPRTDGAPSDGRGPGQCTSFAHWYWRKYYGIKSLQFRGNAGKRLTSAARAWWLVNKTPSIGAFGISNESPVGHVFVVIGIDGDKVLIQEMNYAGRYIVTKRWKSVSSIRWFIHPVKK
jgi:surface antigen/LysM repeat protein